VDLSLEVFGATTHGRMEDRNYATATASAPWSSLRRRRENSLTWRRVKQASISRGRLGQVTSIAPVSPRHPPWANHGPTQPSPLRLSRPRSARRKADVAEAGRQTLGSGRREPLTDDDSGLAQQAHELAARPQSKRRP
jgi:hypothetical protein